VPLQSRPVLTDQVQIIYFIIGKQGHPIPFPLRVVYGLEVQENIPKILGQLGPEVMDYITVQERIYAEPPQRLQVLWG
jgi:hypothetical protein